MNGPNFAVISSQGFELPAAVAASNFIDTCQKSPDAMAAALAIAAESSDGAIGPNFVASRLGRVTPDVASALGKVADLFATGGDAAIDFYPKSKVQQNSRGLGRRLVQDMVETTDDVERARLANQLRLLPFRRYVGQLPKKDEAAYFPKAA